jgi:hypothetical protein
MSAAESQLVDDIASFYHDPIGFVRYSYPWLEDGELSTSEGSREWQVRILSAISAHFEGPNRFNPCQIAVASGHGIGKSALIGQVIHWAMSTCEDCRVVLTANTETQLRTKTWPEVSKWFRLAINSHWWNINATSISVKEKAHERMWRADAIPWSENNTEAFAGLHNKGKRILVIYDEASAIADRIWEVTEGALTDEDTEIIWLAFGNPTKNTGRFRECFGRYKHRWETMQIDSRRVEGTNKHQLNKWVNDYGEDSDFVRVRVRGEFPRAGSTQFISGELVAQARSRIALDYDHHWKVLSVDVARFGDDQTVIGLRQGPKLRILEKLRGQDVVQVARRVMYHMERERPRATVIDGDGVGAGVVDIVKDQMQDWFKRMAPCKLYEFHGGSTPEDPEMYFNRRAEVWGKVRDWLPTADIPDDPEIESDLTGVEYFFSSKNQIQLEKKEDMKKRGLASPDTADMIAMSLAFTPAAKTREELLQEQISETQDPMEKHWMRLRETERRQNANKPLNFWE